MLDGLIVKTPGEQKSFTADFTSDIVSTDTIKAVGAGSDTDVTILGTNGDDYTADMLISKTISGRTIIVVIALRIDYMDYLITVTAEASTAGTKTDKLYELRVRSGSKI